MANITWNARYVGLDVHAEDLVAAVADGDGGEPDLIGKIANDWASVSKALMKLGPAGSLFCCYEAGPTGYGLYRQLSKAGIKCIVVAPSLIPKKQGERIKTDKRDARNLASLLRSGLLTPVWVPDTETEAMRDLVRARDDAKKAQRCARQQLSKFLLRHGRRYPKRTSWTKLHIAWVVKQHFGHEAQQVVLEDYLNTVEDSTRRLQELEQAIERLYETWSRAPMVKALQAFRGIRLVTASAIVAEIGDFSRFRKATEFMSFLGLTPSESSSGDRRRRGSITKAGNTHVRRLLVESAWSYRFRPRLSRAIRQRQKDVPGAICKIAMHAQKRLHNRYCKLLFRGKMKQKVVTAVARELAGFLWAAAQEMEVEACKPA